MQSKVVELAVVVICVRLEVSIEFLETVVGSIVEVAVTGGFGGFGNAMSFGISQEFSSSDSPMSSQRYSGAKSPLESTHDVRVRC